MNMKPAILIAAAIVLSILGAGLLTSNALSGLTLPSRTVGPQALPAPAAGEAAGTLTVISTGLLSVSPDKATLNLSLNQTGESAKIVNDALTQTLSELTDQLKAAGVAPADLQTFGLNLYSDTYTNTTPIFNGSTSVNVIVRDLSKIGAYVDLASAQPGYSSCYFSFDVEDRTEYYKQALDQAAKEGEVKAQALATSMGKKLGAIVSVQEVEDYSGVSPLRSSAASDYSTGGIVESGSVDVRATLTIVYGIE